MYNYSSQIIECLFSRQRNNPYEVAAEEEMSEHSEFIQYSQTAHSDAVTCVCPVAVGVALSGSKDQVVHVYFLCQLTCQSADIMSSLCGVGVHVRVNNFFSKTTRPRDMLFFLKDTLSIEDEKLFKACKSVCSSVC